MSATVATLQIEVNPAPALTVKPISVSAARRRAAQHGMRMLKLAPGLYKLTRLVHLSIDYYEVVEVATRLTPDEVIRLCSAFEDTAWRATFKRGQR